jgi:hypothetical protein
MLKFRPHHFLCTIGFEGKGYSSEFTANMAAIANSLRERGPLGDATWIEVTRTADSICLPCPHKRGDGCQTAEKIKTLDDAHAKALGLQAGDVLSWAEAKQRVLERISVEKHREICAPCSWLSSGVCEKALRSLR